MLRLAEMHFPGGCEKGQMLLNLVCTDIEKSVSIFAKMTLPTCLGIESVCVCTLFMRALPSFPDSQTESVLLMILLPECSGFLKETMSDICAVSIAFQYREHRRQAVIAMGSAFCIVRVSLRISFQGDLRGHLEQASVTIGPSRHGFPLLVATKLI